MVNKEEFDILKEKLESHLIESGEIRTDLKWLKKAFWVLAGTGVSFNGILAVAILNKIWK